MAFKYEETTPKIVRIIGDKDNLIGVITDTDRDPTVGPRFHVELLMRVEGWFDSLPLAKAYVRGAEDALRAFRVIRSMDEPDAAANAASKN